MKFRPFFLYEEDNGAGNGGDPSGNVNENDVVDDNLHEADNSKELPTWFSQLSPELRSDESVRNAFGGYKTLSDAVKGGLETRKAHEAELETARKASEGLIRLPTKDSSDDELKAFFTSIGVPKSKDDYHMAGEDELDDTSKGILGSFKEIAWKNGLSGRQADAQWAFIKALSDTNVKMYEQSRNEAIEKFDTNLADLYSDRHSSETRRASDAREAVRLMGEFCRQSGVHKALVDSGLMYDAGFVKQFTDWYRVVRGGINLGQSDYTKPRSESTLSYGKQFNDYVESRRR